jgi:hypothetical protein
VQQAGGIHALTCRPGNLSMPDAVVHVCQRHLDLAIQRWASSPPEREWRASSCAQLEELGNSKSLSSPSTKNIRNIFPLPLYCCNTVGNSNSPNSVCNCWKQDRFTVWGSLAQDVGGVITPVGLPGGASLRRGAPALRHARARAAILLRCPIKGNH